MPLLVDRHSSVGQSVGLGPYGITPDIVTDCDEVASAHRSVAVERDHLEALLDQAFARYAREVEPPPPPAALIEANAGLERARKRQRSARGELEHAKAAREVVAAQAPSTFASLLPGRVREYRRKLSAADATFDQAKRSLQSTQREVETLQGAVERAEKVHELHVRESREAREARGRKISQTIETLQRIIIRLDYAPRLAVREINKIHKNISNTDLDDHRATFFKVINRTSPNTSLARALAGGRS